MFTRYTITVYDAEAGVIDYFVTTDETAKENFIGTALCNDDTKQIELIQTDFYPDGYAEITPEIIAA